jgi:AraC family transcriptional regulator, transcriptional activator FtrA
MASPPVEPDTPARKRPNNRVVAVAYDGLCAFEFGVAAELFGLARPELAVRWYDFSVVSVDKGPLRMLGGLTLKAPTDLSVIERAGTVVLPGWRDADEPPPERLLDALRIAHRRGARIMSICSGVFIVAATGLLDGKAATTHWRYTDRLRDRFADIDVRPDVLYVDNGSILTSAGSAAGIDLGLHLIRRDHGAHIANQVARRLVTPPHRDGGQAQFITAAVSPPQSPSLNETLDWIRHHLGDDITIDDMAHHAVMSARTFARRFRAEVGTPPHHWLTQQRVARAQELLETSDASIDHIATASGFGTAATLRHHFQRETLTSPSDYRSSFRSW